MVLISTALNNQIATQDLNVTEQLSADLDELLGIIELNDNAISISIFINYLALSLKYAEAFNHLIGLQVNLYPCSLDCVKYIIIFHFYRTIIFNSKTQGNLPWIYSGNYELQQYFDLNYTNFLLCDGNTLDQYQVTFLSDNNISPEDYATEVPLSPELVPAWQNYWRSSIEQLNARVKNLNSLIRNTFLPTSL